MHTVSDLRKLPLATLDTMLGTTAAELVYQLCRGVDNSEVVPFEAPKTISDEDSFKRCVCARVVRMPMPCLCPSVPRVCSSFLDEHHTQDDHRAVFALTHGWHVPTRTGVTPSTTLAGASWISSRP